MKSETLFIIGTAALIFGGFYVAKRFFGGAINKSKSIEPYIPDTDPGFSPYYWKAIIKAVCQQESYFDPNAVSSAGCYGLMQVDPSTAEEVDINVLPQDLFNPEINIVVGSHYLIDMLRASGGDMRIALQKYNVGPGAYSRGKRADVYADNVLGFYYDFFADYVQRGETA